MEPLQKYKVIRLCIFPVKTFYTFSQRLQLFEDRWESYNFWTVFWRASIWFHKNSEDQKQNLYHRQFHCNWYLLLILRNQYNWSGYLFSSKNTSKMFMSIIMHLWTTLRWTVLWIVGWEPEGRYWCTMPMALATFWFSGDEISSVES